MYSTSVLTILNAMNSRNNYRRHYIIVPNQHQQNQHTTKHLTGAREGLCSDVWSRWTKFLHLSWYCSITSYITDFIPSLPKLSHAHYPERENTSSFSLELPTDLYSGSSSVKHSSFSNKYQLFSTHFSKLAPFTLMTVKSIYENHVRITLSSINCFLPQ